MAIFLPVLLCIIWIILKQTLNFIICISKFNRRYSTMSRKPPLHTIGAAILAVFHSAFSRARNVTGPVGFFTKTTAYLLRSGLPFIYSVQYQWLTILFLADDCILAAEKVAEKVFPPLAIVFDAADGIVSKAEALPAVFDDVLDNWPEILIYWKVPGSHNFRAKEKDIMEAPGRQNSDQFPSLKTGDCAENIKIEKRAKMEESIKEEDETEAKSMKCSYKQVLEKGPEEEEDENKNILNEGDKGVISPNSNDPIIKLYESSWHTK